MPWRPMTPRDLGPVQRVADRVHVEHPEDPEVFAERLCLYRQGCHVLDEGGAILGYAIAHPWRLAEPPALNARLHALPVAATTYYVHDVALLPEGRGHGHAAEAARLLAAHARAQGFASMTLVAVNRSQPFWEKQGFREQAIPGLETKLLSYGSDAVLMMRGLTEAGDPP
jgi:ribosomal protein S18 acetylase RimI-like enzyme